MRGAAEVYRERGNGEGLPNAEQRAEAIEAHLTAVCASSAARGRQPVASRRLKYLQRCRDRAARPHP